MMESIDDIIVLMWQLFCFVTLCTLCNLFLILFPDSPPLSLLILYTLLPIGYHFSSNIRVYFHILENVLALNRTVIQCNPCSNEKFVMILFCMVAALVSMLISLTLHSSSRPPLH